MKVTKFSIPVFAILLFFISVNSLAQSRKVENMPTYDLHKYHFGFILAMNQMTFVIKPMSGLNYTMFDSISANEINADSAMIYSIESDATIGFTVGIVANLRLGTYFDLRFIPSLAFGERNLEYVFRKYRDNIPGSPPDLVYITKNIPSTFVELPLHLKYKSKRLGNMRAYLLGGTNVRIDLASQAKKQKEAADIQVKINATDVYGEIGVGFDFYFEWFKFGTEIKMSYGILDILKKEDNIYTDGIDSMRSKIFQLSFTFE
ncbi:MAG: porin family protein [Bacteroidales bacterium]